MFRRILFPIDFSDRCTAAAAHVKRTAELFQSEVTMVHVLHVPPSWVVPEVPLLPDDAWIADRTAAAEERLRDYLPELNHLPLRRMVLMGDPAAVIKELSVSDRIDLIMMPTHGYGGFRRFLLGSVTSKVLHDVRCAVWTGVHTEDTVSLPDNGPARILVAAKLSSDLPRLLRWSADLAAQVGGNLHVAHAIPAIEPLNEANCDPSMKNYLHETAASFIASAQEKAGTQAEVTIRGGDIAHVVRDVASRTGACLLIVGRHPKGHLVSHGYSIIRESPCPAISMCAAVGAAAAG